MAWNLLLDMKFHEGIPEFCTVRVSCRVLCMFRPAGVDSAIALSLKTHLVSRLVRLSTGIYPIYIGHWTPSFPVLPIILQKGLTRWD